MVSSSKTPREAGFLPVVLGTNINAYSSARTFYENYGVKPLVVGKLKLGFTWGSWILDLRLVEDFNDDNTFLATMLQLAEELEAEHGVPLVLVGTNDVYVELIVKHRQQLSPHYRFNYPDDALLHQLMDKQQFYKLAAVHGLDTPWTQIHQIGTPFELEIDRFPVIIKPANPNEWWANQYRIKDFQKVYRLHSAEEAAQVVANVEDSGYSDALIIQEFIPGDDTLIWDSVLYLSTEGKAELAALGQVALQEHESHLVGSYTAIVSRYDEDLMMKFVQFLEAVGYTGIANVDMKWDERDEVFKVLEINVRQGRSSYYAAQLGYPVFRYMVDDLVHGRHTELTLARGEALFRVVPKYILRKYVTNPEIRAEVEGLLRQGKDTNPLVYAKDRSPKRTAYLAGRHIRQGKKYAAATWREDPS